MKEDILLFKKFTDLLIQKMSATCEDVVYKKGSDVELDSLFSQYQQSRIWAGEALTKVLGAEELDQFVDLWKCERTRRLRVHEVKKLVVGVV